MECSCLLHLTLLAVIPARGVVNFKKRDGAARSDQKDVISTALMAGNPILEVLLLREKREVD